MSLPRCSVVVLSHIKSDMVMWLCGCIVVMWLYCGPVVVLWSCDCIVVVLWSCDCIVVVWL